MIIDQRVAFECHRVAEEETLEIESSPIPSPSPTTPLSFLPLFCDKEHWRPPLAARRRSNERSADRLHLAHNS